MILLTEGNRTTVLKKMGEKPLGVFSTPREARRFAIEHSAQESTADRPGRETTQDSTPLRGKLSRKETLRKGGE